MLALEQYKSVLRTNILIWGICFHLKGLRPTDTLRCSLDSASPTACLVSDIVHPVQWPEWYKRGVLFSRGVSQLPPALPNSAWSFGKLMYLWAFASHSSESRRLITKYFKFYPLYIYPDFLCLTISKRGTWGVLYFGIQVTFHVLMDTAKLKELFA